MDATGKGWWCDRFAADGEESSSCVRFEIDCRNGADAVASLEAKKMQGVHLLAPCAAQDQAWAYVVGGNEPYYAVFATEVDCVAAGGKDACKPVP